MIEDVIVFLRRIMVMASHSLVKVPPGAHSQSVNHSDCI